MLERDVSEGGVVVGEGERRAVLWDCKREALRGLGVNIRDSRGKTTRNPTNQVTQILERKFLQIQILRSTTDSKAVDYWNSRRSSRRNLNSTLFFERIVTLRR